MKLWRHISSFRGHDECNVTIVTRRVKLNKYQVGNEAPNWEQATSVTYFENQKRILGTLGCGICLDGLGNECEKNVPTE